MGLNPLSISVWADAQCSRLPIGSTNTLFVRFERDFGFGQEKFWGGYNDTDNMLFVFTPTEEYPDETYQIRAYRNFLSDFLELPFRRGDVVQIINQIEAVDATDFKTEFYD